MANVIGDGILGTFQSPWDLGSSQTMVSKVASLGMSPEDFGAVGNGIINDTLAFSKMSTKINELGGGTISLTSGKTYIVGEQTFAGAFGLGYAYRAADIFLFVDCPNAIVINGNGAILKTTPGLRFGSFNPVTGAIFNPPGLPFSDPNYRADIGFIIKAVRCENIEINNVQIHGNDAAQIIGGEWGDVGRQTSAYGVYLEDCTMVKTSNVYTHHNLLDGILLANFNGASSDIKKPILLQNTISEYNARQGLSVIGGRGLTVENGRFNHTGKGALFGTLGMVGCLLETEPFNTNLMSDFRFINCEFLDNFGAGFSVGGSVQPGPYTNSRVHCEDCRFVGTDNIPSQASLNVTSYRYTRCHFVGRMNIDAPFGSPNPDFGYKFTDCLFTDDPNLGYNGVVFLGSPAPTYIFAEAADGGEFDGCTFRSTQARGIRSIGKVSYRNCSFILEAGTEILPDNALVHSFDPAAPGDISLEDCRFTSTSANTPTVNFWAAITDEVVIKGNRPIQFQGTIRANDPFGPPAIYGDNSLPYVPTFTSDVPGATLGNGTLVGRYLTEGSLCTVTIEFTAGTTTTYGGGHLVFSLPLNAKTTSVTAYALLRIGGIYSTATGETTFDTKSVRLFRDTTGPVTGISPGAFATGDTIKISAQYILSYVQL